MLYPLTPRSVQRLVFVWAALTAVVVVWADFLQYTITSRTDMPNAEFCAEIERAAKDLYDLHVALAGPANVKAHL